jgi:hypothetical protein
MVTIAPAVLPPGTTMIGGQGTVRPLGTGRGDGPARLRVTGLRGGFRLTATNRVAAGTAKHFDGMSARATVGKLARCQHRGTVPGHAVRRRATGPVGRRRGSTALTGTAAILLVADGIPVSPPDTATTTRHRAGQDTGTSRGREPQQPTEPKIRRRETPGRIPALVGRQVRPGRLARGLPHCPLARPRAELRRKTRRRHRQPRRRPVAPPS